MLDVNPGHPAMAMALLMGWLTNDNSKEEDNLNYVPLPYLLSFLSSSPLSQPRSSSSCPALSASPATATAAALLFPRGLPSPALPRALSAGAVITVVTISPSGQQGGGDGAAPGG